MTTKHTPGPWRIWKTTGDKWCICETQDNKRHTFFAEVSVGNFWHDEGKANAQLIAAAPELLEALQRVLRYGDLLPELKVEAESAIAKATGTTN